MVFRYLFEAEDYCGQCPLYLTNELILLAIEKTYG